MTRSEVPLALFVKAESSSFFSNHEYGRMPSIVVNFSSNSDIEEIAKGFCRNYVPKYISIVTVETPTNTVIKSTRAQRITFSEQLAFVGGTMGLFTGMSILSFVEIICFFFKINEKLWASGTKKLCNKRKTKIADDNSLKEDDQGTIKAFMAKTTPKAS